MSALVWNVRGANKKGLIAHVRSITSQNNIGFCAIFEPRISGKKAVLVAKKMGFSGLRHEHAVGFSGGIWLLWKPEWCQVHVLHSCRQAVTCLVGTSGKKWIFTIIYTSPVPSVRKHLWDVLNQISKVVDLPWLVAGDFNEIVSIGQKVGGNSSFTSTGFAEWIFEQGLVDLGFSGPKFTWVKNSKIANSLKLRLDRFLASTDWKVTFPEAHVKHLPRVLSDHAPLLLSLQTIHMPDPNLKPFRFQAMWTLHPDYGNVLKSSWESSNASLLNKLDRVTVDLKM